MNNEPIRILCVFSTLDRGGAESMCMNLYRHIDRTKVQFDFVKHSHEKGAFEDEIVSLGGRIYEAPRYKMYNYLQYRQWWINHLKNHPEHQIIHGHFFTISAVYFQIAKKMNRITIGHSHCTPPEEITIKNLLLISHVKAIKYYSDYCFTCSKLAGDWVFSKRRYKILNNAINTNNYTFTKEKEKNIRNELDINDKLVLGHVGRFFKQKNHVFLIDVFNEIYKRNNNTVLVLVGDGALRLDVEKRIKDYGLSSSVLLTGVRDDVNCIMSAFDAFVFPSLFEGLPVVGIEAQAAGLKCFISDTVTKEVDITGRCEFMPINNPKLWADKVLSADLTKVDTSEQIKAAGYDIHTTAKWLEKFYLKVSERQTTKSQHSKRNL